MIRRPSIPSTGLAGLAATAVLACAAEPHLATTPSDVISWRLSAEPEFAFDLTDSRPAVEFSQIRDVTRLNDGTVLVTNFSAPPEIRAFAPDGEHLWSVGGSGEGPGEFTAISWVKPTGADTLVLADPWQARFTKITTAGSVVGVVNTTEWADNGGLSALYPIDLMPDGTLIGQENRFFPLEVTGTGRGEMPLFRVSLTGRMLDSIGVFPTVDYAPGTEGFQTLPLFARRAVVAHMGDDAFLHGMGDDFSFGAYSLEGELLREYRRPAESPDVTPEMIEALKEAELARVQGPEAQNWRAQVNRKYAEGPGLETLPAYERFLVASDGTILVQGYHALVDETITWSLFDPAGPFLGTLEVPATFRVTQVEADRVAGVWRDDLDVESPRLYVLERGSKPQ